ILALTLEFSASLDATCAVAALEAIAQHPDRENVRRDMRFARLVFDLDGLARRRAFRARLVPRALAAVRKLGLRQPALVGALCVNITNRIEELPVSVLPQLLSDLAGCSVGPLTALEALTTALSQSLHTYDSSAVGEVAEALSTLRFRSERCLAALFDVTSDLGKFQAEALTKILWCLDTFGKRTQVEELAGRAFGRLSDLEDTGRSQLIDCIGILGPLQTRGDFDQQTLQPLAASLARLASGAAVGRSFDVRVPHLGPRHTARALRAMGVQVSTFQTHSLPKWVAAARSLVAEVFGEEGPLPMLPISKERSRIPVVEKEAYAQSIQRFGVDNFGKIGGRCLMNQLGIGRAEEAWLHEVKHFLRAWSEDVTLAIKLTELNTSWQADMLRCLTAQRSAVLREVSDAALGAVSRRCSNLESIDVSGCKKISAAAMVDTVRRCPSLKTLIAVGCLGLASRVDSVRGWDAIRKAKPGLEVINHTRDLTICALYEGSELWFTLAQHRTLDRLMDVWCARKELLPWMVQFVFEGRPIARSDTCASLSLEEGDQLEVLWLQATSQTVRLDTHETLAPLRPRRRRILKTQWVMTHCKRRGRRMGGVFGFSMEKWCVGTVSSDWKAQTAHRRIYAFAEFSFASTFLPGKSLLEGTLFQLNGLHADPEFTFRPWLCAVQLPISKWVDRSLCAEFQLLGEVCELLHRSGMDLTCPELRYSVHGDLNMYLSEPSCVSCVGAMKQFQTLLPGANLFVECGSVIEPLTARRQQLKTRGSPMNEGIPSSASLSSH
ncbi:Sumo3, partial [Symbiodinium sp. KB8]